MELIGCRETQAWVRQVIEGHDQPNLPTSVVAHIAACPMCRAALALIMVSALQLQDIPQALTCDRCEDDLAAFLDLEAQQGSLAAARQFPAIWWHLWTCVDCVEVYARTRQVLQAHAAPPSDALGARRLVLLVRSFLLAALPTLSPQLGSARGSAAGDTVLAIQEDEEPQFTVGVRRLGSGMWRLTVQVDPPPTGQLRLSLGETHFRAQFNAQGVAVVSDVPNELLAADSGPDLEIALEGDA